MTQYKSIEWSYPTSPNACKLGYEKTGCYSVEVGKGHAPAEAIKGFPTLLAAIIFAKSLPMPFGTLWSKYNGTRCIVAALDPFTKAYIEAALWSSSDEGGDPLDINYDITDIAESAWPKIIADCDAFQIILAREMADYAANRAEHNNDTIYLGSIGEWSLEEHAGHDFWLTRNGHGCGFLEKSDWEEIAGKRLTEESHKTGEVWPSVGDDGAVYF